MEWSTSTTQLVALVPLTIVIADRIQRYIRDRTERNGYPLPPGPTPLPFLGNILSIDTKRPWLTYTEWKAKYGDIMYVRLMDTDVIVLNSASVAMDLLEKRSQIYSDRPFIATIKAYGHDGNFAFARYGEHWRQCRRILHQTFRAEAALAFRPMQICRARQMIVNIIEDPEEYPLHYCTFSSGLALSSVYDYEPKLRNDPMVSAMHRFLKVTFPVLIPEQAMLLKTFPFLLYIPDWLPGSSIKREAGEASALRDMINMPYQDLKKRIASKDNIKDTMVFNQITRMEAFDDSDRAGYEIVLKHAATTAFIGSAETSSAAIMTFTLAMVENPRIWKRAQAEIDAVVGLERLPEFSDRSSLPYVEAIMRETLRWKPLVPLGLAHSNTASDIYKGFYIPKGTFTRATVLANIWAMSYDEARYPNPEVFSPERFLDAQGLIVQDNPAEFIFGFGRRFCQGRHIADASVWSAIATMLATLQFNTVKDENGSDVVPEPTFSCGLTLHPNEFPCCLTPRAHITKEVLERILADSWL